MGGEGFPLLPIDAMFWGKAGAYGKAAKQGI
jgi:hypothetical protein